MTIYGISLFADEYPLDPLSTVLGAYYDLNTIIITATYPVIEYNDGGRFKRPQGHIWIIRARIIAVYDLSEWTATKAWTVYVALLTVAEHNARLQQRARDFETVEALTRIHERSKQRPPSEKTMEGKRTQGTDLLGKCSFVPRIRCLTIYCVAQPASKKG